MAVIRGNVSPAERPLYVGVNADTRGRRQTAAAPTNGDEKLNADTRGSPLRVQTGMQGNTRAYLRAGGRISRNPARTPVGVVVCAFGIRRKNRLQRPYFLFLLYIVKYFILRLDNVHSLNTPAPRSVLLILFVLIQISSFLVASTFFFILIDVHINKFFWKHFIE